MTLCPACRTVAAPAAEDPNPGPFICALCDTPVIDPTTTTWSATE